MKYIQITEPDSPKLKKLIRQAKGERSLERFASDIKKDSPDVKVSAPTLSRVVSGDRPISVELLQAIVNVSSDASVTLPRLISANGMCEKAELMSYVSAARNAKMKDNEKVTYGLIRRIDDLGRIVIPREIRQRLYIHEGDALEIAIGSNPDEIVLRRSCDVDMHPVIRNICRMLRENYGILHAGMYVDNVFSAGEKLAPGSILLPNEAGELYTRQGDGEICITADESQPIQWAARLKAAGRDIVLAGKERSDAAQYGREILACLNLVVRCVKEFST